MSLCKAMKTIEIKDKECDSYPVIEILRNWGEELEIIINKESHLNQIEYFIKSYEKSGIILISKEKLNGKIKIRIKFISDGK
jgi:TusA-related sulfurtransferase